MVDYGESTEVGTLKTKEKETPFRSLFFSFVVEYQVFRSLNKTLKVFRNYLGLWLRPKSVPFTNFGTRQREFAIHSPVSVS